MTRSYLVTGATSRIGAVTYNLLQERGKGRIEAVIACAG